MEKVRLKSSSSPKRTLGILSHPPNTHLLQVAGGHPSKFAVDQASLPSHAQISFDSLFL
ncbi:hypothetical protein SLEP1_g29313 [Rubroshorea leprosula]|uniref:Uncharacterized protein n=1 Tax=Rubroshorea leprosula TaxID=152421 RepID=A0AAV5JWG4_9ROSI|nr:hypothetical protein SLEP1_g29313 [Rubroshorea leprosula]